MARTNAPAASIPATSAPSRTRTADRVLELLAAVCAAGTLTLADAARATELSASTALRLLRTLEASGFIAKNDDGYQPGLRMLRLGAQALGNNSLISFAAPTLATLVHRTGESAYLSVRAGEDSGVYLAMQEGTHSVRHAGWVGKTVPLDGTALGAALRGTVNPGGFVVVVDGHEPDTTSVAAPIRAGERVVAALSIVGPTYRINNDQAQAMGRELAGLAGTLFQEGTQR